MDDIWLAAPGPAVKLWQDATGTRWQANPAALAWARDATAGALDWAALAAEVLASLAAPQSASAGTLAGPPVRWTAVPLGEAWLVWLTPAPRDASLDFAWSSPADKLALVQRFGRLGMWERDLRTGEGRWDADLFRLFGLDPSNGQGDLDLALSLIHPDDRDRVRRQYAEFVREPGRYESRYRLIGPDGRLRHLHVLLDVRAGADGRPDKLLGVTVDDTEGVQRVLAQEAVSAKFEKALGLANVSVWHIDAQGERIVFNDYGYELAGLGRGLQASDGTDRGLPLASVRDTVHPDDLDALRRAAEEATQRNGIVDVEARYRKADGGYRHLLTRRVAERDADGNAIGLMGISLDLSEHIAERHRAQALARRIELVAESARVGIWSVDVASGQVEWNAEMFRIYGLNEHDGMPSLQRWIGERVHPDDRRPLAAARRRSVESGARDFSTEFRIVRPDGTVRRVVCRSRREAREGGDLVVGIHLDVTEHVEQHERAEQALLEREAAQRASRAKSEFLAQISHELRTPLNAVLGFTQLIEHDADPHLPALQRERLAHIRSAGEHLLALIADVLDVSAIEAGSLQVADEAVEIDAVFADVAAWAGTLAAQAGVTLDVVPSGGWVRADARRLRQIVVNLANDAIRYSRRGGRVGLAAARGDGGWYLSVRDDGRGLTAVEREHLSDAFERMDVDDHPPPERPGVGLTIVRRLAECIGGRLDTANLSGRGSEFRVWLPAQAPVVAAPAPAPAEREAQTGPYSVLYIEDNPINVILVKELIAMRPGIALACADDGASGVRAALALRPDLVLIDMQLPDFDGYEVMRRLRREPALAGASLVALSANGMSEEIARARSAGFDDYWTKPIDFKRFLGGLDALTAAKSAVAAT